MAAASPFRGSMGLGYARSCGKNDSNILVRSVGVKKKKREQIKQTVMRIVDVFMNRTLLVCGRSKSRADKQIT